MLLSACYCCPLSLVCRCGSQSELGSFMGELKQKQEADRSSMQQKQEQWVQQQKKVPPVHRGGESVLGIGVDHTCPSFIDCVCARPKDGDEYLAEVVEENSMYRSEKMRWALVLLL